MSPTKRPKQTLNMIKCDYKAEMPSDHIFYLEDLYYEKERRICKRLWWYSAGDYA